MQSAQDRLMLAQGNLGRLSRLVDFEQEDTIVAVFCIFQLPHILDYLEWQVGEPRK